MSEIKKRCTGRWFDLLTMNGIDRHHLSGRHGPCPICGGKDRFRYDDKDGNGTYFCNSCGPGDGFNMLMKVKGWTFAECASELEKIVGKAAFSKPRQQLDGDKIRQAMNNLWLGASPVVDGDPVDRYLTARGVGLQQYPEALRYASRCTYHHEGNRYTNHPAMIAMVTAPNGKPATLHRTYLNGGSGKADLPSPRRVMPGKTEKGSAIRLSPVCEVIGIAEGIETALSASVVYGLPVWAALNAGMLMQFEPPEGVHEVHIFGDHDANFAGQSSANALAHRLSVQGFEVEIQIPDEPGDWNDFLISQNKVA
jgi:putative DNA primase/helicase